jgi:arylsulfatase A-like enzyme
MKILSAPFLAAALYSVVFVFSPTHAADPKPNILLIIADDMGDSDITCFGGEVQTPHIDALAKSGIRATNFYVAPTCSPTRSMLLSGCDHHVAGFGNMDELAGPEQKKLSARRMEVYAAMLANMDHHIGRLIDHLKQTSQYENTLVVFLSDNGAEPVELGALVETVFSAEAKKWYFDKFDTSLENMGRKGSATDYGAAWAQVGSTPFRFYKAWTAEGGIRSPMVIAGAGVKNAGAIKTAVLHVTDLVPTFLELAGAKHPSETHTKLAPLRGKSLTPLFTGKTESVRTEEDWIGEELFGNHMIRQHDWKICYIQKTAGSNGEWELFNLKNDPGETTDLSKQEPAKTKAMLALWDEYLAQNGVILTDDGPFKAKAASQKKDSDGNWSSNTGSG